MLKKNIASAGTTAIASRGVAPRCRATTVRDANVFGAKNAIFAFYLEHFIICQGRLGTDIQQTQKKTTTYTVFVFAGNAEARYYWHDLKALIDGRGNHPSIYQVLVKKERKTAGFGPSTVDLKNLMAIVSPRPARDKRRGR